MCLTSQEKLKTKGHCFRRMKLSDIVFYFFTTFSLFRICLSLWTKSIPTTIWDVKDTLEFIHLLITSMSKKMSCQGNVMSRKYHNVIQETKKGIKGSLTLKYSQFFITTKLNKTLLRQLWSFHHNTELSVPKEI